jgi:class 3 adenylate cyclase
VLDVALLTDLAEMLGRSLTFKDIEAVGGRLFGAYDAHRLENVPDTMSVSPLAAARRLLAECEARNKLDDLVSFVAQLDGNLLNGRTVDLVNLDSFLYRLSLTGRYFDYQKRRLVAVSKDKSLMPNWGALRDGKEYPVVVVSADICGNSRLVKKHSPRVMEKVYYGLWDWLRQRVASCDGRIWSWAGDGGLLAFRYSTDTSAAVRCCLEILLTLPVFNLREKPIKDDIVLRMGMDAGPVKFASDTGRIVSDVVNYAAHLEKKGTEPWGLSISDTVRAGLAPAFKRLFCTSRPFEGRTAWSVVYDCAAALRPPEDCPE